MPGRPSELAFDAVLFDVDGTLVDSLSVIIAGLGDAYERFDGFRPSDATIRAMIGMPLRSQLAAFRGRPVPEDEIAPMIDFVVTRFEELSHLEREFAPAIDALRELHDAGTRIALVTSKNDREIASFIRRFRASDCVDAVVCASDVERPKPDPESALEACRRLGVSPRRTAMIGDSIYDLQCAKGAGVTAIAVAYGAGSRPDLNAESPELVLDTPQDVLAWSRSAIAQRTCLERN